MINALLPLRMDNSEKTCSLANSQSRLLTNLFKQLTRVPNTSF